MKCLILQGDIVIREREREIEGQRGGNMNMEELVQFSIGYKCCCVVCTEFRKISFNTMRSEMRIAQINLEKAKESQKQPEELDEFDKIVNAKSV